MTRRRWAVAAAVVVVLLVVVGVLVARHRSGGTAAVVVPTSTTEAVPSGVSTDAAPQVTPEATAPVVTTLPVATTLPPTTVAAQRAANRPDPALTPGAVFADVTAAQVCVSGYSSKARNVSQSTKERVFVEYGVAVPPPSGAYEVDHLVALELGGSNELANLWPEPYQGDDNAHIKDAVENRLHSMVCAGSITLVDAQAQIVRWWEHE